LNENHYTLRKIFAGLSRGAATVTTDPADKISGSFSRVCASGAVRGQLRETIELSVLFSLYIARVKSSQFSIGMFSNEAFFGSFTHHFCIH
jgi:hypothetical protein